MNLLEHEGKRLFEKYRIDVPEGVVISSAKYAPAVTRALGEVVFKVQVPSGKRGKSGGIIVSPENPEKDAAELFKKSFDGNKPKQILIEKKIKIDKEFYLSLAISRSDQSIIKIFSERGGVDIESLAEESPEQILKRMPNEKFGLKDKKLEKQLLKIANNMLKIMTEEDATLVEINPLVLSEGELLALDSKIVLDDNASFRHKDRVVAKESLSPLETKAKHYGLNYVELDGNIGIIGNGAGLVMGTLDMIKHLKGKPANFLDVGGGADSKVMGHALSVCLYNKKVKGLMVNIFGGITHCDEIAKGLVAFKKSKKLKIPIVVRMIGTDEDKAKEILKENKIEIFDSMTDCAKSIIKKVKS